MAKISETGRGSRGSPQGPLVGCRGKAPAGGMGAKPPSAEDKLHSEGPRLPYICSKNKQVTFFPWLFCLILFNFGYLFEFAFSLYLVHAIFTAGLFYELPFAFSGLPLLSCLSKIPAKQSETPYKTRDTQNVSVYLDKWHGSNFNHANIRKGAGSVYGCTV